MAGMVWLLILATWSEEPARTRAIEAHPEDSGESVAQEPKTGHRLVERRSQAA
jgi:hypothetical protein